MLQVSEDIHQGRVVIRDQPTPLARFGRVLIANTASVISAGTEKIVIDFAHKSLLGKARERPDQVRRLWEKVRDWQKKALDQGVRKTKGNNRIKPKTSSKLTPADENPSGGIVRPDFDLNESFEDFVPGRQGRRRRFN